MGTGLFYGFMMLKVIVANKGSYYHESFWNGKSWVSDIEKAKTFPSKPTDKQLQEAIAELDKLKNQYSYANPQFTNKV